MNIFKRQYDSIYTNKDTYWIALTITHNEQLCVTLTPSFILPNRYVTYDTDDTYIT
jgi:hypothetical protein